MSVFISYLTVILKMRSILFFIADTVMRCSLRCLYTVGQSFTSASISLSLGSFFVFVITDLNIFFSSSSCSTSHLCRVPKCFFFFFFPRKTEWSWYSIEYVTSSAPGYIWRTSVWKNSHAATNYLNIINNTPNDQKFPIFFGRNIFISTKLVRRCHFMA